MAASNAAVERWASRLICWSVSKAKKRSTWLIHDADVGVKCICQRSRLANQSRISFGLMARGIVHDDVNVEIGGHMLFDGVEEAAEFLRPVARHAFADDGSGLYVEGGKERGRPVPLIVMGVPFDLPGSHREQRLGAIQRLDLRFLIDAEHQRVVWRVEIEADNVAHPGSGPGQALVNKQGGCRQLRAR